MTKPSRTRVWDRTDLLACDLDYKVRWWGLLNRLCGRGCRHYGGILPLVLLLRVALQDDGGCICCLLVLLRPLLLRGLLAG